MTTKMIKWNDVQIYGEDGPVNYPASGESLDEFQARIMAEYRYTGSIHGYYLADPADFDDEDSADLSEAGPKVSEIDFQGIPM